MSPYSSLNIFVSQYEALTDFLAYVVLVCSIFRYNHPEVFCKKGILRNFGKFTGKHMCLSLLLNEVAGLRPATY